MRRNIYVQVKDKYTLWDRVFAHLDSEHCIYIKEFVGGNFIVLLIYLDDALIVG